GYSALAIDLLSEEGGTGAFPGEAEVGAALAGVPPERFDADMKAGVSELRRRLPRARLAAIGFGFGGGMVWRLLAARERRLAAAVAGPGDRRARALALGADPPAGLGGVQPRLQGVAAGDRELAQAQEADARVSGRVAARGGLELRPRQLQAGGLRVLDRALEAGRAPAVVDGAAVAVELVAGRLVQAGGDEQAVERKLGVVAAGAAVADRHAELLLDRRARVEAGVVVGAEEVRLPEGGERLGELARRLEQVGVVARSVGLEPVAIVVGLELAQELECLRRPHAP